jgi:methylenetetrahydrofolate dehydrogenase (NADP+)/methenyltetrahydrofolate cyclohydrolase
MSATIIDGKKIAATLSRSLQEHISALVTQGHPQPGLTVILVGHNPASAVYVRNKQAACEKAGIQSTLVEKPASITEDELVSLIEYYNHDAATHGILVQLPLPHHINVKRILETISPHKDVDGFHPANIGKLAQRDPFLQPCTPLGVMHMLQSLKLDVKGMNATVIGASQIVGRPMAICLMNAGATVTVCHRFTKDLRANVENADCLVVAAGHPGLVPGSWIKPGAIVIDVGMNRLDNGKLVGDVDFAGAKERASYITPVPGGVGPMTVACLLQNTVVAYEKLIP